MPTFQYKAKNKLTSTVTGQVSAQSRDEAVEMISQMGLLPVSVEEQNAESGKQRNFFEQKIRSKDLYLFTRQMVSLIKAGVPLLRALGIIQDQLSNAALRTIVTQIGTGVRDGRTFSDCLGDYPDVFSSLYVAMVRAGEESGNLKEMLMNIAEYQKSQEDIGSKVRSALAYPILMAVVGFGTVVFILTFVMPRIVGLFTSAGEALPAPTRILLGISHFLQMPWVWGIAIVLALIFLLQPKKSKGSGLSGKLALRLPWFGDFILKVELARFCRTLALLLKSGTTILRAMQIAIPILNNDPIRKEFAKSHDDLAAGNSFGASLKTSKLVPPIMANVIAVGEETGSLADSLGDVADTYEQDINEAVKTMTTLFEPLMILAVGLVVGFIVFAMLLPIFQIDVFTR